MVSGDMDLKSQLEQFVKQYIVYDGSQRAIEIYTAPAFAGNGAVCTKVTYVYDGGSSRIVKMKEERSTWSSAYDI